MAPYWRSAGCRARHRARALSASLDLCGNSLCDARRRSQYVSSQRRENTIGNLRDDIASRGHMDSTEPTKSEWITAEDRFTTLLEGTEKVLMQGYVDPLRRFVGYTLVRFTTEYPASHTRRAAAWRGPYLRVPAARFMPPVPPAMNPPDEYVTVRLSHEGANGFTVIVDGGKAIEDKRRRWFRLLTVTPHDLCFALRRQQTQLGDRGLPRPPRRANERPQST